jgi:tetratricopeptide (TPR) repeat protein
MTAVFLMQNGTPIAPLPVSATQILQKKTFAWPQTNPVSCQLAHQRAAELSKEFNGIVPADVQRLAQEYVNEHSNTSSIGQAWDDFALALFLMGDAQDAAWCGLNAVSHQWTGDLVTNEAVYLIYLNRLEDALLLLNCAYASGYHSPYLFEALSTAFRLQGQQDKAKEYILLAQALAPDDPVIPVEASMATTGTPPVSAPLPNTPLSDDLESALAELIMHAQRITDMIQHWIAELDRLEHDPEVKRQRAALFNIFYKSVEKRMLLAQDYIKRARMTRQEFLDTLVPQSFPVEAYSDYVQFLHNQALQMFIGLYFDLSKELLQVFSRQFSSPIALNDMGAFFVTFWAEVLNMDPVQLDHEFRKGGWHLIPAATKQYWEAWTLANEEERRVQSCNGVPSCLTTIYAKQCALVTNAYDRLVEQAKERYGLAADRFNTVAQNLMTWGEHEVLRARLCHKTFQVSEVHHG